ncbi:MAG: ATP-binding protein [Thomasclavelia sp.]
MAFQITSGKQHKAKKVVFYGPEGIGKSTFASKFPDPLFIDTEGSTTELDVNRYPKPTSWEMLMQEIREIIRLKPCKTLVIDTADWAERLCTEHICVSHGKKGVEDFGYGNGYTYIAEEWGRFLNLLQDVIDIANINVVLTAHAIIRKFEQPNEMGAYDRYELKLGKKTTAQTAPLTKEWADMVLFANYKTFSVAVDEKGKKHKAQGGQRVMYTTHHPCWDAKNRYGLPEELPLDYSAIAHIFDEHQGFNRDIHAEEKNTEVHTEKSISMSDLGSEIPPLVLNETDTAVTAKNLNLPKALTDLMEQNLVMEEEIRKAVALKGYYPENTPIENYDPDFINGVLVGAWPQVLNIIENQIREF